MLFLLGRLPKSAAYRLEDGTLCLQFRGEGVLFANYFSSLVVDLDAGACRFYWALRLAEGATIL